jgi:hypothetical protein
MERRRCLIGATACDSGARPVVRHVGHHGLAWWCCPASYSSRRSWGVGCATRWRCEQVDIGLGGDGAGAARGCGVPH